MYYFYLWVCVQGYVSLCAPCKCRELQADVNPLMWVLETYPVSSVRTVSAPLFVLKDFIYLLLCLTYIVVFMHVCTPEEGIGSHGTSYG